jgi:hypothetical protein
MNKESRNGTSDGEATRLQEMLARFETLGDPAARAAAQELVRLVIDLHGRGLSDLLGIVQEAGSQPADTLLARFTANPAVRGMLLLHDLHPEDLATRASKAVERLRPHLGVRGVRADLIGVEDDVVRLRVSASGQKNQRPSAIDLQREIENVVLEMTPDAADLIIEGLETAGGGSEVYVPLATITRRSKTKVQVTTPNDTR